MPKNSKKYKQNKDEKVAINTGGGAFISGSVHTNSGDIIGRDKINISGEHSQLIDGNVSNSSILTGEGNTSTFYSEISVKEFLILLEKFRALLLNSSIDPKTKETLESDVKTIQEQVKKEEPDRTFVLSKLRKIAEAIFLISKSATEVSRLSVLIKSVIEFANKIF